MAVTTRIVHADLDLQARDRYHRVPFAVPAGAPSVGVRIFFDDSAVIDLGCEGADSWRGWSGGARTEFTISADGATPGYVPGPLEEGRWAVILGLHNLPKGPVDVTVEVSIPSTVQLPDYPSVAPPAGVRRGSSRELPAPGGTTWLAGDFHNHTVHSDGRHTIEELARLGVEMGLDFLAVTDHNTVSHHAELDEVGRRMGITLIPGQEVTSHRGHANAFGDIGWIDFRQHPNHWVEEVEARGGILSINHPVDGDCSWVVPLDRKPGAVELWHSSWYRDLRGGGNLAWFAAWDRTVSLIGGNDFHSALDPQRPGTPVTWVAATDNTPAAILEAVRVGRTTITGAATWDGTVLMPQMFGAPILVRQDEETIIAIDADSMVLVDFAGRRRVVLGAEQTYYAPRNLGPYTLVRPDRMVVALSP